MKKAAVVACLVALVFLMSVPAAAEECNCPPSNAMSNASTRDPQWRARWCGNQGLVDALWFGLNLDETGDLWDDGWGYEDVCNDNLFLSRLFNAGFIVREVDKIAPHFPEPNSPNAGHQWWNFVNEKEDDGFEPKCCNQNLVPDTCCLWATHYCCATSTDLCLAWGFNRGAASRSSTLVHEATHDDVSHIDDDDCANDGSCDTFYGDYNANTMQINYLYDATAAYLVETVNNKKQRRVGVFQDSGKQMCGYIPLLEQDDRDGLLADVKDRLDSNFKWGSVFANYFDAAGVDAAKGTPWECANCNVADYTFSPQTFGTGANKACNEVVNGVNVSVNQSMRAACTLYNSKVGGASGASAYGQIKDELYWATTGKCQPCDEQDTNAYCQARRATADNVSELDPHGLLSSCGYYSESGCLRSYCQEKFQNSWVGHAGDPNWDDPRGCLDAVCGNDWLCRKRFLTYGGDPQYYDPDGCTETLLECYESKGKTIPGATPGRRPGPEIPECTHEYTLCRIKEAVRRKVMGMMLVRKWVAPGDPVSRTNPWEYSAQERFRSRLSALKSGLDRRRLSQVQFEQDIVALMGHRESMAAAFNLEPEVFVHLFGRGRLEGVVGPSIRAVRARAPRPAEFDARGRVLLQELQNLSRPRLEQRRR